MGDAMPERLDGKVALITGGAGNIGQTLTRSYLAAGATVVISGRNPQKLAAFREQLLAEGGVAPERLMALAMDGSNMSQVRAGIAEVMKRFGRIDVLVNNAGSAGAVRRLAEIPLSRHDQRNGDEETLAEAVGNLLGGAWNLVRAAAPHLQPGASIINISTIFSRTEYYGRAAYAVPKAALNALTLGLARELGERGIRVNCIYPGPIDTERLDTVFQAMDKLQGLPEASTAASVSSSMLLSRVEGDNPPARIFPKTTDVASTAVFLASDAAAAFTGQGFEVTNGMLVPGESRTTLIARPSLRAVDASGRVVMICAGDQVEDAMALTGVLRSCGAEVIIGFRSRAAIAQMEQIIQEGRPLQGPGYTPPLLTYLNPLDPSSVEEALGAALEYAAVPERFIVLPARGPEYRYPSLTSADDETVAAFLQQEMVGTVALASQLARFWETKSASHYGPPLAPRVLFISNGDDGRGNLYADIIRAAVEELVRIWRHEVEVDHKRQAAGNSAIRSFSANQIVRYVNEEMDSLDFACAWAARLINTERQIAEINLYVPRQIEQTTGSQRPVFGWAESLIGLHLGKTAVITGGSAGIGGQVGRLLALAGARVLLAARGADQLKQLRDQIISELREIGYPDPESRIHILADSDVASESQMVTLAEHTLSLFGRIDYLINNAGMSGVEEMVIDMPIAGWNRTLQANLISNYSLIRKLAPQMKAQGSGYILNVSSYFGGEKYVAIPYPNRSDYAVSKAGQRAMAEVWARFMGPEVQINALAPGPVEGERLKGTGERPGLFARRARLILENRRLNDLHAALIEAHRATGRPVADLIEHLASNDARALTEAGEDVPDRLRKIGAAIQDQDESVGSSRVFLMNKSIAQKLVQRLRVGGYLPKEDGKAAPSSFLAQMESFNPPDPFFARPMIDREARKVRDGIMSMLYLHRMPTEYDVAIATVYYLADRAVSGETFHPSGGLRFERTATEGELFARPTPERLAKLRGRTAFLIGEYLSEHLTTLARAYLDECGLARVVLITETEEGAQRLLAALPEHRADGRLVAIASGGDIEGGIDRACAEYGRPGPIISTPFRALPKLALVGRPDGSWSDVLSEQDFADLIAQQITHHFRVTQKGSLMDGASVVLVTPETTARSTTEEFALANFVKTTMHAFTSTAGVESERTVHRVPVNQVDLTRRARSEEPRSPEEEQAEMARFVDAVLLTSAPLTAAEESRYQGRIYRGKAITV